MNLICYNIQYVKYFFKWVLNFFYNMDAAPKIMIDHQHPMDEPVLFNVIIWGCKIYKLLFIWTALCYQATSKMSFKNTVKESRKTVNKWDLVNELSKIIKIKKDAAAAANCVFSSITRALEDSVCPFPFSMDFTMPVIDSNCCQWNCLLEIIKIRDLLYGSLWGLGWLFSHFELAGCETKHISLTSWWSG